MKVGENSLPTPFWRVKAAMEACRKKGSATGGARNSRLSRNGFGSSVARGALAGERCGGALECSSVDLAPASGQWPCAKLCRLG